MAQETLSAERGMTMLELAERLGQAGFKWLVQTCAEPRPSGVRPIDDSVGQGPAGVFETEISRRCAACASSW